MKEGDNMVVDLGRIFFQDVDCQPKCKICRSSFFFLLFFENEFIFVQCYWGGQLTYQSINQPTRMIASIDSFLLMLLDLDLRHTPAGWKDF